jgi:hypothetical protein
MSDEPPIDPESDDRARFLAACANVLGFCYAQEGHDRELALAALAAACAKTPPDAPLDQALRGFVIAIAPLIGAPDAKTILEKLTPQDLRAVKRKVVEQALSVGPTVVVIDCTHVGDPSREGNAAAPYQINVPYAVDVPYNEDVPYAVGVPYALDVPAGMRQVQDLKLRIGYNLEPPIHDLTVNEHGIIATLHFRGVPHTCYIPWDAVWACGSEMTHEGVEWELSKPQGYDANGKRPPDAPEPRFKGDRPRLGLVPMDPDGGHDISNEDVIEETPELNAARPCTPEECAASVEIEDNPPSGAV